MKKKKAAEKSAAGDYAQPLGEGFEEYRRLREQGYSKEEATRISYSKIPLAILSNKADDYIGKNSGIDKALYGKTYVFDPEDNKKFREALNSRNTNDIIITEEQIGKKIKRHHNDYDLDPGSVNDRIKFLNIVDDIIDNADEVVEGKWKGQEGTILFYRKGEDLVLVRKNDNTFVSVFKGGANNGWFKDLGR